jgi:hypothetical protein
MKKDLPSEPIKISTYRLFYDGQCVVCRSFVKLMTKNVNPTDITFLPLPEDEPKLEFILEGPDSLRLGGEEAMRYLTQQFPFIKKYFFMLPPQYRTAAVLKSYRLGRWLRSIIYGNDCNCSK